MAPRDLRPSPVTAKDSPHHQLRSGHLDSEPRSVQGQTSVQAGCAERENVDAEVHLDFEMLGQECQVIAPGVAPELHSGDSEGGWCSDRLLIGYHDFVTF